MRTRLAYARLWVDVKSPPSAKSDFQLHPARHDFARLLESVAGRLPIEIDENMMARAASRLPLRYLAASGRGEGMSVLGLSSAEAASTRPTESCLSVAIHR